MKTFVINGTFVGYEIIGRVAYIRFIRKITV